jgi:hypothetical protein
MGISMITKDDKSIICDTEEDFNKLISDREEIINKYKGNNEVILNKIKDYCNQYPNQCPLK